MTDPCGTSDYSFESISHKDVMKRGFFHYYLQKKKKINSQSVPPQGIYLRHSMQWFKCTIGSVIVFSLFQSTAYRCRSFGGNSLYPKVYLGGSRPHCVWWNACLWTCLVGNCKKTSGVTLCKLVEESNCCLGHGVKAMFMAVWWKQKPVWEWPHWGSWQHSLSSFVSSKPFDAIETEQGREIERAKASASVKVQSSVMQCEIAAEWALPVCKRVCVEKWVNSL